MAKCPWACLFQSGLVFRIAGLIWHDVIGAVAQLGERCVRNAEVEGSIPFRSTNLANGRKNRPFFYAKAARHPSVSLMPGGTQLAPLERPFLVGMRDAAANPAGRPARITARPGSSVDRAAAS